MPHFDEYGGDEWICQICTNVFNSKVESTWMRIPGREFEGNVCPTCSANLKAPERPRYRQTYQRPARRPRRLNLPAGENESGGGRLDYREPINRLDYSDDPAEFEVQRELARMGISNRRRPNVCPHCDSDLSSQQGMAGEEILVCPDHSIVWEDSEDAIRRVF